MVPLLFFLRTTVFEKDLWFVKLAHDFKDTPEAKFQIQWTFSVCYTSFQEAFFTGTLLSVITTFFITKVRQLTELTDPLSAYEFIEAVVITFVAIVFEIFVDTISIAVFISSHSITKVSATLLKYLLFSQIMC